MSGNCEWIAKKSYKVKFSYSNKSKPNKVFIFALEKLRAFYIVAAKVVYGDTNHGPALAGVTTDHNRSDNFKCTRKDSLSQ